MEQFADAVSLSLSGRFSESYALFSALPSYDDPEFLLQKALVLERVGRGTQSRHICERLLGSRGAPIRIKGFAEFIIGQIIWEDGDISGANSRFLRAISLGRDAGDPLGIFWPQIRRYGIVTDQSGPEAGAPLLSELRQIAIRQGSPRITAALHVMVGQAEAKRGALGTAIRHTNLALMVLRKEPNPWLEALAHNTLLAAALTKQDPAGARQHGEQALELAEASGSPVTIRACLSNLGYLAYKTGRYQEAAEFIDKALRAFSSRGENNHGSLDTLALIRLAQGQIEDSDALIQQIEEAVQDPNSRTLFAYRHSRLTKIHLRIRQGRLPEALEECGLLAELVEVANDRLLATVTVITKADVLRLMGRVDESARLVATVLHRIPTCPPDVFARYEALLSQLLAARGRTDEAHDHALRARRVYTATGNIQGIQDLDATVTDGAGTPTSDGAATFPPMLAAASALQSAAVAVTNAARPEIVAHEIVHALTVLDPAISARVDTRTVTPSEQGDDSVVDMLPPQAPLRLQAGAVGTRAFDVVIESATDLQRNATIDSVRILSAAVHELQLARAEREERSRLWPADDFSLSGQAVVSGTMRSLMELAGKVGRSTVTVLLTGESGTGKEVVARAIHAASDRAGKPLVAFNCTAIPDNMLESQLFGYRRGAFTGADRDHPGLLRAAAGGTVLLDEIGEMGLDLQPKLLRFLESGEVLPLGESTPVFVDVRVIAATNQRLERAIAAGTFREDLFYRLNVVRIETPPLRERRDEIPALVSHFLDRFGSEAGKGHLRFSEDAMEHLLLYRWPGNIRELVNELRRIVAMANSDAVLSPDVLKHTVRIDHIQRTAPTGSSDLAFQLEGKLTDATERLERAMIQAALRKNNGHVDQTAKELGLSRKGLYLKRQRLGLD